MKIKSVVLVLSVSLLLMSGCIRSRGLSVSVEPVQDATKKKVVDGIPFYKKIPVFTQTSIYLDPFYEVRLFINYKKDGSQTKAITLPAAVSTIYEEGLAGCNQFYEATQSFSALVDPIAAIIKSFDNSIPADYKYRIRGVDDFTDGSNKKLPVLYSNVVDSKMIVDWKNQYYINYKVPIAGSSSLTAELSGEGTLNKVTGETEDKTLSTIMEGISTLLPLKEYLTAKWIPKSPDKTTQENFTSLEISISLEIEKKVCKYTLSKFHSLKEWEQADNQRKKDELEQIEQEQGSVGPAKAVTKKEPREMYPAFPAIELSDPLATKSLELIDQSSAKKDDKKDAQKNAIEFSGQVKLPAEDKNNKK
jgi:hypothetical protein